jgi:hypothetical protein
MDRIPIGILPLVNNTIQIKITVELGCKPVTITVTYNKIAATFWSKNDLTSITVVL